MSVPSVPILNIKPKASNNTLEFYWSQPTYTGMNSFTPKNISSLQFWLDANDETTLTLSTGSQVLTQLTEKAQNAIFTPNNIHDFLIAQPSTIGSNQTLWFNNQFGDYVYLQGPFNMTSSGAAAMVFTAKEQYFQAWRAIFGTNVTGGLNFEYINGNDNHIAPGQTNIDNGSPINVLVPGTTYLIYFGWSTNTAQVGFFGQTPTLGNLLSTPITQTSTLRIGSDTGTCVFMNLGELLLFDSPLTAHERQEMEGYLAWKWGLNNQLPTNHPYWTNDPRSGVAPLQGFTLACPTFPYISTYTASTSYALISTGVTNTTDYNFSLCAYNLNGPGPQAYFLTTEAGLLPSVPTNIIVLPAGPSSVNIYWQFSAQVGEATTKWFVISINQLTPSVSNILKSVRGYERSWNFHLQNSGTYSVTVFSVNDVGYCYQTNQNTASFTIS